MFPMVSGVGELRQVRSLLAEARQELAETERGAAPAGCMIELPSAVFVADLLAREADFFSIGTNDLIQYSLALDRGNDDVAYLYSALHPAVLRALRNVIEAATGADIPVAMCGGMASEPMMVPILIGLGLRSLSMTPTAIPFVKAMIRAITVSQAEELTSQALQLTTATEIEDLVRRYAEGMLGLDFPVA
jgi:phosphotransferase system enzyme I (PtsI)